MKNLKTKLFAGTLAVSIIVFLIMIGPAQAFISGFTISDPFPKLGDIVSFIVKAVIEPGEVLDIKNFTIMLTGPVNYTCTFDTNGTILTACPGSTIQQLSISNFSFGYGFLPGTLQYNFTLDTSELQNGTYDTKLIVALPDSEIKTSQQQLVVQENGVEINKCSLRAKSGVATFESESLDPPNRLTLFVPAKSAVKGQGSITAGRGKSRVSYKFDITKAVLSDSDAILFETSGKIRQGRGPETDEQATIAYFPGSEEIDVSGNSINIEDMDVNLARC